MRIENRELLDSYHGKPCACCGDRKTTVAHHVKTKGSGGDDVESNLIPLCHEHHAMVHNIGLRKVADSYFGVNRWLAENGWEYDFYMGRYTKYLGEQDQD